MTSIIKFEPLSGVFDESPLCYLLQIDDFTFLLDCGWEESFNMNYIKNIKKHIHKIDAVLLSYPDFYHLGALPYLVGKCGLLAPIYATIPVYKMGQMFMYDIYQSHQNNEEFKVFTLDDVDTAFDRITQLKFSQSVGLKSKGHGLQITPSSAGHMIGGAIWKIVKDGEEEIVYAVDFNHKKERHLNGCQILETLSSSQHSALESAAAITAASKTLRPCSLLITDTLNALYEQSRRRSRDEALVTKILHTIRNQGGNVLLPIDTAGRILEIAHLLDQLWRNPDSGFGPYPLCLLNNVSYNVVAFAQSQIEWMSEKIAKTLVINSNNNRENDNSFPSASPFHFKHLILCHSLEELERIPSPKVVLASTPGLDSGFARDLFVEWCGNPKNTIILTIRTSPGTLARTLIDDTSQSLKTITLEVKRRVPLEGAELVEFRRKEQLRLLHHHSHSSHAHRGPTPRKSVGHKKSHALKTIDNKIHESSVVDSDFSSGHSSSSHSSDSASISTSDSSLPTSEGHENMDDQYSKSDKSPSEKLGDSFTHRRRKLRKHKKKMTCKMSQSMTLNALQTQLQPIKNYDIYIPRDVYIDELAIPNFKRYRRTRLIMIPYVEKKVKWDEYGEPVDLKEYNWIVADPVKSTPTSNNQTGTSNPAIDNTTIAQDTSESQNITPNVPEIILEKIPTKCVSTPRTLIIKASINFIDFEGKSDGESYKKIIAQMKPKQLILVHGPEQATLSMATYFKTHPQIGIPPDKIFCPRLNEVVNATLETRIFKVKIKDALASRFRFSKYKGTELGKIRTKVDYEIKPEEMDLDLDQKLPALDIVSDDEELASKIISSKAIAKAHKKISDFVTKTHYIGDIKLTEFKQLLVKAGFNRLDFLGPVLICNDLIAIRKNEVGKISIEGPVSTDYFKIRELFYQQFATI